MWWTQCWDAIQQEFSDIGSVADVTRVVVRLLVALALGGLLGYERESAHATAGLRTHMLVALGGALFVLVPQRAGVDLGGVARVMQGVTTGIGFLGAGAIIKQNDDARVEGLTTAANIWLTAAVGLAAGLGRAATALLGTLSALVVLAIVRRLTKDRNQKRKPDSPE